MTFDGTVLVAGAGAIGATTAGELLRDGRRVVLVDQWHQNVDAIRRRGLSVQTPDGSYTVDARVHHLDELRDLDVQPDLALLCCKAYDTELYARVLHPYLAPCGAITSLQNGVNEELLATIVGPARTVGCVVHYTAAMFEPGAAVRFAARHRLSYTIGDIGGTPTDAVGLSAAVLSRAGRVDVVGDVWAPIWAKMTLNVMSNALTALTGATNRRLWASQSAVTLMSRLGAEAVAVCRAQDRSMSSIELYASGHQLEPELVLRAGSGDVESLASVVARFADESAARGGKGENVSSMLQDVCRGRRTEIDHLNGYVVRAARSLGLSAVANEAMVAAVRELGAGTHEEDRDAVASRLLAEV